MDVITYSYLKLKATVYPKKYAHGFVVLCFVVVMQSFKMNSHEVFIHIHQGCFAGTGAIVRLPQCQWSKPDGYGTISQCITTTKHSKAKTVCIFLGIYCISPNIFVIEHLMMMYYLPIPLFDEYSILHRILICFIKPGLDAVVQSALIGIMLSKNQYCTGLLPWHLDNLLPRVNNNIII